MAEIHPISLTCVTLITKCNRVSGCGKRQSGLWAPWNATDKTKSDLFCCVTLCSCYALLSFQSWPKCLCWNVKMTTVSRQRVKYLASDGMHRHTILRNTFTWPEDDLPAEYQKKSQGDVLSETKHRLNACDTDHYVNCWESTLSGNFCSW